ncbi:hypothetical protein ANO11243_065910 [Dothideomycetidae sp. 11243]|nr:hypothetical protein ANO11243_065910 [fungal sp. No.11243]
MSEPVPSASPPPPPPLPPSSPDKSSNETNASFKFLPAQRLALRRYALANPNLGRQRLQEWFTARYGGSISMSTIVAILSKKYAWLDDFDDEADLPLTPTRPRLDISLAQRLALREQAILDPTATRTTLAAWFSKRFGMPCSLSTVSTTRSDRWAWLDQYDEQSLAEMESEKGFTRHRSDQFPELRHALCEWYDEVKSQSVTESHLRAKAWELAEELNLPPDWARYSVTWLRQFREKYCVDMPQSCQEAAQVGTKRRHSDLMRADSPFPHPLVTDIEAAADRGVDSGIDLGMRVLLPKKPQSGKSSDGQMMDNIVVNMAYRATANGRANGHAGRNGKSTSNHSRSRSEMNGDASAQREAADEKAKRRRTMSETTPAAQSLSRKEETLSRSASVVNLHPDGTKEVDPERDAPSSTARQPVPTHSTTSPSAPPKPSITNSSSTTTDKPPPPPGPTSGPQTLPPQPAIQPPTAAAVLPPIKITGWRPATYPYRPDEPTTNPPRIPFTPPGYYKSGPCKRNKPVTVLPAPHQVTDVIRPPDQQTYTREERESVLRHIAALKEVEARFEVVDEYFLHVLDVKERHLRSGMMEGR